MNSAASYRPIAAGVWLLCGGPGETMNVYLLLDGPGVLAFDAGIRQMTGQIHSAASELGGLTRIVLSHAHVDHRGAAPGLGVPVYVHPDDKADAAGDAGRHYLDYDEFPGEAGAAYRQLHQEWDGGPVEVTGTLEEGDEVAGFEVIHLPGHAPGQIALWRHSDRLALSADCFFTLDLLNGQPCPPRTPPEPFNFDTEQARGSIGKLAALEPAAAWPGHAGPILGDVAAQLEQALASEEEGARW